MTQERIITGEEAFFLHLMSTANQTQKMCEEAVRVSGVTVAEYTLLRIVENAPGITAGEARARLYATAPSIAQLVAQLEGKKLLQRVRDPVDARRLPLRLTADGKKSVQKAKRAVSQLLSRLKLPQGLLDSLTTNLSTYLSSLPPYGTK